MSKRKLLLADDSITIQKVVNLTFADEGVEVITVGDGDSAIEKVSESRPDLVLADVHMPGLNGYEVCELLRSNDDTKELPVLLLVGSFEPFDESEAERVGANGFMTKPFQSIRQLVTKVSELMETSAAAADSANGNGTVSALDDGPAETEAAGSVPVETETASQEQSFNDTGDIEELYNESVGEVAEPVFGVEASTEYLDAGMDDEMIDARYADSSGSFTESPAGNGRELTYPDANTGDLSEQQESPEHLRGAPESQRDPAFDQFSETERMDPAFIGRETPVTGGTYDQSAEASRSTTGKDEYASPVVEAFEFDDLNLLELPPVGQAETLEITTPQDAAVRGGAKQLVTLSPEMLDIIVQRVIDKISERK